MADLEDGYNAADPARVRHAARKAHEREQRYVAALRAVLDTPEGREVWWGLLGQANVMGSVWSPDAATVHYLLGRQDLGREILADILLVDQELYFTMQREAKTRADLAAREAAGVHTRRAEDL